MAIGLPNLRRKPEEEQNQSWMNIMKRIPLSSLCILAGVSLASMPAAAQFALDVPPGFSSAATQFGDPLPGLTADQAAAFFVGLDEFTTEEVPDQGLGPIFNSPTCAPSVACATCHAFPVAGGSLAFNETRFGLNVNGMFDPLANLGGSLQEVCAIDPVCQETNPVIGFANGVIAGRQTTPLFGMGLIEAIPDQLILWNARLPKPYGIRGRAALVQDVATGQTRVGRFGWKAQVATLLTFSGDAYLNEMGITSRLFPQENAPNGNLGLLAVCDLVPDPEDLPGPDGKADIDKFTDFMRFLAPPPRLPETKSTQLGEATFITCGCAFCHIPAMFTGANEVKALSHQAVPLYSDLLLHNMGPLGDGIAQGAANTNEMRTAPLWGVRASAPYLHDGRAATLEQAIQAHNGEAAAVRDRYLRLPAKYRSALVDFLNSL